MSPGLWVHVVMLVPAIDARIVRRSQISTAIPRRLAQPRRGLLGPADRRRPAADTPGGPIRAAPGASSNGPRLVERRGNRGGVGRLAGLERVQALLAAEIERFGADLQRDRLRLVDLHAADDVPGPAARGDREQRDEDRQAEDVGDELVVERDRAEDVA